LDVAFDTVENPRRIANAADDASLWEKLDEDW
jgi:hypothetical protein